MRYATARALMTLLSTDGSTFKRSLEASHPPQSSADLPRKRRNRAGAEQPSGHVVPIGTGIGQVRESDRPNNQFKDRFKDKLSDESVEALKPSDADIAHKRSYRRIDVKTDWTAGLSTRSANALRAHGIQSRQALLNLPERKLKRIPNIGRTSLEDIRAWIQRSPDDAMHRSIST